MSAGLKNMDSAELSDADFLQIIRRYLCFTYQREEALTKRPALRP